MCCSVSPGVPVRFSDTVLYAAEVIGEAGDPVHVLGYQNKVQGRVGLLSLAVSWLPLGHSGNAMILPFPAVPRTMTRANVLDTKHCRDILQDMADAVAPRPAGHTLSRAAGRMRSIPEPPPIQVFKAAGIYTVILAQDPRDIPAELDRVPRSQRPALNPALFDAYARWYPGWTIALCCFSNRRARLADPLLWWYEPMSPDRLFLPAVDCHTGDVPDLDSHVAVDHVIAVGSYRMAGGRRVVYRDTVPGAVAPYLRPTLIGQRYTGSMPNGDFVCELEDVCEGTLRASRSKPVAA
jgi:hypothetical protein